MELPADFLSLGRGSVSRLEKVQTSKDGLYHFLLVVFT